MRTNFSYFFSSLDNIPFYFPDTIAYYQNLNHNVVQAILDSDMDKRIKNSIYIRIASRTEDGEVYKLLSSVNNQKIQNALRKNPNFEFEEKENLSKENELIIFMIKCGDFSEEMGLEMLAQFNVPAEVQKVMLEVNSKWKEFILANGYDFGDSISQLKIAKNSETDAEILEALSKVAKNAEIRKAIINNPNCTIEIARNMFG